MTDSTVEVARKLDQDDPLASFREQFHHPKDTVYLCGHSLGLQPKAAAEKVQEELEDWKRLGVRGHREARRPWAPYHELLAEKGARIVGAEPDEVVHMNTLTVNVHLLTLIAKKREECSAGVLTKEPLGLLFGALIPNKTPNHQRPL